MSQGGRRFGYRRRIGAPGRGHGGCDVSGQGMSARFEDGQPLLEPAGRRPVLAGPADHLRRRRGAAFGQPALRRDQARQRADQLVGADPQGGLGPFQLRMSLLHVAALQVHVGQRDAHGRGDVLGHAVADAPHHLDDLVGMPGGAGQLALQGLRQGEIPQAVGALISRFRYTGGQAFGEVSHRRIEAAGPEFYRSTARQQLHGEFGMPGVHLLGQLSGQDFRSPGCGRGGLEISGPAGQRQPDQRGGQPGRDLVASGKPLQDAFRGGQRGGTACLAHRIGQPRRG